MSDFPNRHFPKTQTSSPSSFIGEPESLITEHLDIWTAAIKTKSAAGRGSSKKLELVGVKKLRELILELAVRGKLVQQDPNDESASELIKKIEAEKARLVKEGKIKKQKPLPPISDEEKPFELPIGWGWKKLGDLGIVGSSSRVLKKDWQQDGIPFYRAREIVQLAKTGKAQEDLFIGELLYQEFKKSGIVPSADDIMITGVGTIGVPYIVRPNDKFYFKDASVLIFKNIGSFNPEYLRLFMNSPLWNNAIHKESMGTTVHTLTISRANNAFVCIPPAMEQRRIVAKVDELMALCDQLEAQTESSIQAHQLLVETLLATLTNAKNADELNENWQTISQHFDVLFTTQASIDQLKQTILQLAVMGKLVKQDPNDEPASKLLERIATEKQQLIKDGKIKKQKPLPAITDDEKPFELPQGWKWTTLSHIGVFTGGKTPSKANSNYWNGDIPWVTPKDMKVEEIFDSEDHVSRLAITDGLAQIDKESLLFVARSGILRRRFPVAITKSVCTVNQDLKVLTLIDKSIANYVLLMMKGFEAYILENLTKIGTTVESLRFDDFSKHYFMMPPLTEQHRIVVKVDELMELCNSLKARLNQVQTTQLNLTDAIVEQAL